MKQLLVEANLKNINLVEEFIATATDIPQDKRSTALIIATEVFDNIAEHAILVENTGISLAASKLFFPRLCFSYTSSNFDNLLRALKKTQPHFDSQAQRYRGFGLLMTRNLARKVRYCHSPARSNIIVYL
ncbi:MAG: hypothetical protein ACTTI6_05825 [Treponema sp.]|uniref:hypothetical protein n=1 Tax=Treponema sp. TaxID=166 RepID=UPI003FA290B7